MNSLSYEDALVKDKRTFFQYYISLIMTKQLLIFTFHCKNDFNSKIIKICFLPYIFALFFFMNTLFIDEATFHDLFLLQGKVDILYNIEILGYIAIISYAIKNILSLILFTESNVVSVRNEDEEFINKQKIVSMLTTVTIKTHLFFALIMGSLVIIWVYIACFFTIFINTQMFVLRNTGISFGISM